MSRLLLLQDDNDDLKFVGNAFKVTGAAADIDDLKKVQTPNRISFILLQNIFRREMTHRPHLKHVL